MARARRFLLFNIVIIDISRASMIDFFVTRYGTLSSLISRAVTPSSYCAAMPYYRFTTERHHNIIISIWYAVLRHLLIIITFIFSHYHFALYTLY